MDRIKDYLKTRKVWRWLSFLSVLLGAAALILYLVAGRTQFDPGYSVRAILGMALGIGVGVFTLGVTFRAGLFVQYLCFLFGFLSYVTSQMNLLGNLVYNVDGSTLPAAFILITLFSLAAFVPALVGGILMRAPKERADAETLRTKEHMKRRMR